ncbi:hypothetical protein QCA50_011184 [Cerrena zonata]|uniref:Uncharacterized protein n=1 Tax=Cerrena zonata TaxID=2478898 RepID=A0AAW0FWE3_9APHY
MMSQSQRTYPKPVFPPTPDDNVRIVVLGSGMAGTYTLATCPTFPRTKYKGDSFLISVHCRSEAEANEVWMLQSLVRMIEHSDKTTIEATLMGSALACGLFVHDGKSTIDCYASLFNRLERPCIYLSWDDAHPHHFQFTWSKVARAKTFVDALVLLCHKKNISYPWSQVFEFPRPVSDTQDISLDLSRLSLGSSQSPPSRSLTASEGRTSSDTPSLVVPDTAPPSYYAEGLSLPTTSHAAENERDIFESIPVWALGYDSHSWPHDYAFVRVRDIEGRVIRSYNAIPSGTVSVPSLGSRADRIVDMYGCELSTILRLYFAYKDARLEADNPCRAFIIEMVGHGMCHMEAGFLFDQIEMPDGDNIPYRERLDLDSM